MTIQHNTLADTPQDDEEWLATLSGTQSGAPENDVQKEALLLREAILKKHAEISPKPVDEAELQQFRNRLRRENLWAEPFYRQTRNWAMAASLIVCVGIGIVIRPMMLENQNSLETMRGVDSDISILYVENPKATTAKLSQQLAKLGIVAKVSERENDLLLEAYVPSEQEDAVNTMLLPLGGQVENKGRLRFYFRQGKQ